uniref:Uncharacterized protein n=1 Tax=Alexandrium catenella TaxID=2925 RepID=A0A7S1RDX2_ALECA
MVKGFETKCQGLCTCVCLIAMFLAAIATLLSHVAFSVLVTPLVELPTNLVTGIDDALHFATLQSDSTAVKQHAQDALAKPQCSVLVAACPNPPAPTSLTTSNTSTELAAIVTIFDNTLAIVEKVANDQFLGVGDFAAIANDLSVMRQNLTQLRNMTQPLPCQATNQLYCSIYSASDQIINAMGTVRRGVNEIKNNPAVADYETYAKQVKTGFHGLPYIMWVSLLFYACFWFSRRPSCKGGCGVACACVFHGIFFFLAFVVSVAIVGAGIVSTKVVGEMTLGSPFVGNPTIAQLIDHIETNFPGFYNVVLKNLLDGMKKTFNAYVIFLAAQILLLIHTCTCCCGVYVSAEK